MEACQVDVQLGHIQKAEKNLTYDFSCWHTDERGREII